MSRPVPSPSMKGMIGLSGTFSLFPAPIVIGWPLMAAGVARIYAVVMSRLLAIALLFSVNAACNAKNEAIVCKHENENVLAGCKATYDLCAGGQYVLDCKPEGS